jgi:prephenate dehydratase
MIAIIDAGLRVVREVRVPIALALMTPTGVTLNQIRRLFGSELAFRLCNSLLETLGSVSQEIASFVGEDSIHTLQGEEERGSSDWGIVAPEHLAITSGLSVIAPSVSDFPQTTLRFFACALAPEAITNQLSYATSLLAASQQASGSLSSILDIFRRQNIVLTKLESLGTHGAETGYRRMPPGGVVSLGVKPHPLSGTAKDPKTSSFTSSASELTRYLPSQKLSPN